MPLFISPLLRNTFEMQMLHFVVEGMFCKKRGKHSGFEDTSAK